MDGKRDGWFMVADGGKAEAGGWPGAGRAGFLFLAVWLAVRGRGHAEVRGSEQSSRAKRKTESLVALLGPSAPSRAVRLQ